jgi:hypothetical protein
MEKKIYSQPITKVLSIADVCESAIDFGSVAPAVYGPAPEPVEPVKDLFN